MAPGFSLGSSDKAVNGDLTVVALNLDQRPGCGSGCERAYKEAPCSPAAFRYLAAGSGTWLDVRATFTNLAVSPGMTLPSATLEVGLSV